MNLFQIFALIFLSYFLASSLHEARNKSAIQILYALRWFFIALVAFIVIADPAVSVKVANFFGIYRGTDFVVYSSVLWMIFKLRELERNISKLEHKIEDLVRKQALQTALKD